ncbi:MAG: MGMT family protein [Elusimicrobia bacterium]|nr:MGMT family protein [Elusimicrobiota bacterium]
MPLPKKITDAMRSHPAFYQAVWKACAEIPAGEVRTYGWLAARIGRPGAARAVGTALGANPFAPVVPCHRVVRSDGGMGGYSGPGGRGDETTFARERRVGIC